MVGLDGFLLVHTDNLPGRGLDGSILYPAYSPNAKGRLARMTQIRALIVDDHPVTREGLRTALDLSDDVVVVGEAATGEEAVEQARELTPDVVFMDVRMPGMDGIEATRRIQHAAPGHQGDPDHGRRVPRRHLRGDPGRACPATCSRTPPPTRWSTPPATRSRATR